MKLQIQPNRWSCLPTAFGMLLDIPVDDIIKVLGHDGSDIIFDGHPEQRRGFHPQELVDLCVCEYDMMCTIIEVFPSLQQPDGGIILLKDGQLLKKRYHDYLRRFECVIWGSINGNRHAVAWDRKSIYDPNGTIYGIERFTPEALFLI